MERFTPDKRHWPDHFFLTNPVRGNRHHAYYFTEQVMMGESISLGSCAAILKGGDFE